MSSQLLVDTSLQVDIKHIVGLPLDVFKEALYVSKGMRA